MYLIINTTYYFFYYGIIINSKHLACVRATQVAYEIKKVKHTLNANFSHCDHSLNLPCDVILIVFTCVLIAIVYSYI